MKYYGINTAPILQILRIWIIISDIFGLHQSEYTMNSISVRPASSARVGVFGQKSNTQCTRVKVQVFEGVSAVVFHGCSEVQGPTRRTKHHDMYIDLPLLFFNCSQRLGHNRQDVLGAKSPVRNSFGNCAPVLSMMRLGHYTSLHNAFLLGLQTKEQKKNNTLRLD